MNTDDQSVIFLGVAERAIYIQEKGTNIGKWNIIGLKSIIPSIIFPMNIDSYFLGFCVKIKKNGGTYTIRMKHESGIEIGNIELSAMSSPPEAQDTVLRSPGPVVPLIPGEWAAFFVNTRGVGIVIPSPGKYDLEVKLNEKYINIGKVYFPLMTPLPFSEERKLAIKSDPRATTAIRMILGCKYCESKYRIYTALDKLPKEENSGFVWYEDIGDEFVCMCGGTKIPLDTIKKNLHGLLGTSGVMDERLDLVPLYEKSMFKKIHDDFAKLLNKDSKEEIIQKFIEENPIVLHQFPAERIFKKPPILTRYVADFGILTPKKELILIEIEKTSSRIMKKNGDTASPLTHAMDQVGNWLHTTDEHRQAFLVVSA